VSGLRLNLGCGAFPFPQAEGWVNVDSDDVLEPDVCDDALCYLSDLADGAAHEIYMGHLLEHFDYEDGQALLRECYRVLVPGGRLGVVVPNTRAIMWRYLRGAQTTQPDATGRRYAVADLDDVCAYWLFSTVQPSPHRWAYDGGTLCRALERVGFVVQGAIDSYHDPRLSDPSWWQLGLDAERPA
jgi:SAM-dependent methyltransferase